MAAPQIPPRPVRSQDLQAPSATMDIPRIPPRPKRSVERSVSPHRDTFARSPLNDPAFLHNGRRSKENASPESIRRPPSVSLPSIGQEGMEYASISTPPEEAPTPEQTKNVAGDLPLHQPKASVPASTAKSRIQGVTRTDSSQAAAAGYGKSSSDSDKGVNPNYARSDTSTGSRSRPQSIYKDDEEHGIPEIGLQVPMYPNAGDVQAPTPSPYPSAPSTGIGFFNNVGQNGGHHTRSKSGRQVFSGPPGSYGMHGHGVTPRDEFEKSWYEKHPEDAAREMQGEYGPAIQDNRKEWNMSKEDLNRLVHQTASRAVGQGTSRDAVSTPDEEIGYLASEEYASRMASPKPSSRPGSVTVSGPAKHRSGSSQTHAESPLRKMVFPINQGDHSDHALESEAEEDVIHIDPPAHRRANSETPTERYVPHDAREDESGYKTPILASDELAKNPHHEYLQPAVSPELERRSSGELDIPAHLQRRPKSRNNSLHRLSRVSSADDGGRGTPLENVKEYEPLFPDDSDEEKKKKPKTQADKLKRPDLARHQFPSQDVWEDTPSSLQLETTVETPDLPENEPEGEKAESAKPAEEAKPEASANKGVEDEKSFLQDRDNHSKKNIPAHVLADVPGRPGMAQRFPSQDVWEDAPDHVYQYTTVETPEPEEPTSAVEEKQPEIPAKPTIPARPQRTKPAGASAEVSPVDKKAPTIPERPKPQVPARPSKPAKRESSEEVPLTKTTSGEGAPAPKAKPAVPARPGGSKIAALKAGFLSDLNSKLGLGPQAPKIKEPEEEAPQPVEEKAPLADARKGRAKGPQRRKPTASPSPAATAKAAPTESKFTLSFAPTVTVFSISADGSLQGPAPDVKPIKEPVKEPLKEKEVPAPASEKVAEPATEAIVPEKEPASKEDEDAPSTTEASVQTGQQDIKITSPDGSTDEATAYVGGKASGEGNVVVDKDGVEHVSGSTLVKSAKEEGAETVAPAAEP